MQRTKLTIIMLAVLLFGGCGLVKICIGRHSDIVNATGQVLYSAPLDVTQTTHTVNLQTIPTGQYTVRIETQGSPLDSKTLIVY